MCFILFGIVFALILSSCTVMVEVKTGPLKVEIETNTVTVEVLHDGKPVEGIEIRIGDKTALTDKDGVAHFSCLPAGEHLVVAKYKGREVYREKHSIPNSMPGGREVVVRVKIKG